MRNYKQLSQAQRYQIEILKKAGKNQKEIAELLGVSPATICRELKRNIVSIFVLTVAFYERAASLHPRIISAIGETVVAYPLWIHHNS